MKNKKEAVAQMNIVSGGDLFQVRISPTVYTNLIAKLPIIEHGFR